MPSPSPALTALSLLWLAAAPAPEKTSKVKGPLTKESIADVVHEHRAQVRSCQESSLGPRPSQSIKLTVAFTIEMDGAVSSAEVTQRSASQPALEKCLAAAVKLWRFPKPKHSRVTVNFPFAFGAAQPADAGTPARPFVPPPPEPVED